MERVRAALLVVVIGLVTLSAHTPEKPAAAPPAFSQNAAQDSASIIHVGSALVYNGMWVQPSIVWEMAYAWTEKCVGKKGNYDLVHFAVADSIKMTYDDGRPDMDAYGLWFVNGDGLRIIVYRADDTNDPDLIVHEMIHDIGGPKAGEWPTPFGAKPSKEFSRCLPSLRGEHD